ncbi:MAG TPA: cell envelope integrity protein CreD [Terriglobia bacterium]
MTSIEGVISSVQNSRLVRLCMVGALALILLIPVAMIGFLVSERHERRDAAIEEVSEKWGRAQTLTGPALILPYAVRRVETVNGKEVVRQDTGHAVFLPKRLKVTGRIDSESRSRGIFSIAVYRTDLTVEGEFSRPNLAEVDVDPGSIFWNRAHLAIGITDVRAIRGQSEVAWNGSPQQFLPGTNGFSEGGSGIHALVHVSPEDSSFKFSFPLSLNGSVGLYLTPFAEDTSVQLASNSPFPNFQGNWLPSERTVSANGFDATWRLSYLGRDYPQWWTRGSDFRKPIAASRFGVEMADPVDHYRMADRSVKYAILFILLTFAFAWLIEVTAGVRVHPIQYLLLGAALCVFYLLELSLSEHLTFPVAYSVASLAVIGMIAAYSRVIFGRVRLAGVISATVTVLYGYLFVLLTNEDAALLVGSIGLFVILGAIMFLTRRVNWYSAANTARESTESV